MAASPILKNSLGTKGIRPKLSALSYPIIDPKYPTPKAKITIEPKDQKSTRLNSSHW